MNRHSERLEAIILVLSFLGLCLILMVCVLKWDAFVSCFERLKRCCCRQDQEDLPVYRNVNELLFDASSTDGAVRRLATDESDENPREVSMDSFFPDLLGLTNKGRKKSGHSDGHNNGGDAQEPLL
jgi:hypothetical protein